ncbi:hypothetical protein MHU86_23421 [Fragilaria crotonensis]|nr:hypothetical protein MHU86_23421 [Fragilaria crotonensis]
MQMANIKDWKERTAKLRRKIAGKARGLLRWSAKSDKRIDFDTPASLAEQPLLRAVPRKAKKTSWDSKDELKDMSDYAAASAMIAATFSNDTKSTASSGGLYRSASSHEERFEFPNFHKRDIYLADGPRNCHAETDKVEKRTLAAYSISGSMLCSNVEKGYIPSNSTSAARKLNSPLKPTGLPANAVMASTLFRTMKLDDRSHKSADPTKRRLIKTTSHSDIHASFSNDSGDERAPYVDIKRTNSKDGAQSSVSSVTMYSSYQNDPLVRASNSLLDILRSNRFQTFDKCEEETSLALYEA